MEILDYAGKVWQLIFIAVSSIVSTTMIYSKFSRDITELFKSEKSLKEALKNDEMKINKNEDEIRMNQKRLNDLEEVNRSNRKIAEEMSEIRVHLLYIKETVDELKAKN